MKKKLREVKDALFEIKIFRIVAIAYIVVSVALLILAAWAYGLVTLAEKVPGELSWEPDVLPFTLAVISIVVLIFAAFSLYITGKARKALQGMNTDKDDE